MRLWKLGPSPLDRLLFWYFMFVAVSLLVLGFTRGLAGAVLSPGHSAITRLWAGDAFACTGFFPNVQTGQDEYLVYVVTAGHCVDVGVDRAQREATDGAEYRINWRALLFGRPEIHREVDVALGTVPRPTWLPLERRLFLADAWPESGTSVWVVGYPAGVEALLAARVTGSGRVRLLNAPPEVLGGASGAPVVDEVGQVVGILWGAAQRCEDPFGFVCRPTGELAVTPVSELYALLKALKKE